MPAILKAVNAGTIVGTGSIHPEPSDDISSEWRFFNEGTIVGAMFPCIPARLDDGSSNAQNGIVIVIVAKYVPSMVRCWKQK